MTDSEFKANVFFCQQGAAYHDVFVSTKVIPLEKITSAYMLVSQPLHKYRDYKLYASVDGEKLVGEPEANSDSSKWSFLVYSSDNFVESADFNSILTEAKLNERKTFREDNGVFICDNYV
ncbi:hypothetical protein GGI16_002108 [Coemansia sp. S142-1]|nr:hypothetical protein GGI16_002108 [Coemansia sp. S142-1]